MPLPGRYWSYKIVPKDEFGETDLKKLRVIAQICSVITLLLSLSFVAFYFLRLVWCYDNLPINSVFYGVIASLTCQVGIQSMNVAFAILYVVGTFKDHNGFLFLWLVSVAVLLSLESLVVIYAAVLRNYDDWTTDNGSHAELAVFLTHLLLIIGPIIICLALYRSFHEYSKQHREEIEILL